MKVRRSKNREVRSESRGRDVDEAGLRNELRLGGGLGMRERSKVWLGRPWTTARWLGRLIICCQ
jgi:hypothetical protein